jgi:hypothetical protein
MAILREQDVNRTTGARAGGRRERDSGRAGTYVSQGGLVGRPTHQLVRPLDSGADQ